ncbi:MAG: tetratricopeptide repeat protein [Oscillospiraceae bacterium]|nr:tetratricopeptide repeat protein [Oscillospiraceae bacterium]
MMGVKMISLYNLLPDNILILNGQRYKLLKEPIMGGSSLVYVARPLDGLFQDVYMIKEFYPHDLMAERKPDGGVSFMTQATDQVMLRMGRVSRESEIANALRRHDGNNDPLFLSYSTPIQANNTLYTIIATEAGAMLSQRIDNGYFRSKQFEEICDALLNILAALKPIHEKGYLHLDVSPDNIHFSDSGVARLLDYNSAFQIEDSDDKVLFSVKQGYSAPELYEYSGTKSTNLSFATDLFSVAAIFFELLTGRRLLEDDWRYPKKKHLSNENSYLNGASTLLLDKANLFLQKGLSLTPKRRFKSVDEMRKALSDLKKLWSKFSLENNQKRPYSHFIGREGDLKKIDDILNSDTYVILEGIGGIGKSELAKRYAWQFRERFDIVQFITYDKNLVTTIATSLRIRNFDETQYEQHYRKDEVLAKIFEDKMTCLQSYDKHTLLVIDNYNVSSDDNFHRFVSGDYRVIFTSREKHSENAVDVLPLETVDDLWALFSEYYGRTDALDAENLAAVTNMFKLVLGHTMTVMLIAAAMKVSGISAVEMLSRLRESFDPELGSTVAVNKEEIPTDLREQMMHNHILNLFDMSRLTKEQSYLMVNMSVVPYTGVERELLFEWVDAETEELDKLIHLRWIEQDMDTDKISLHPVISDVANSRLCPDSVICAGLLEYFVSLRYEFFKLPDGNERKTYVTAQKVVSDMGLACKRIIDEAGDTACLYTNFADMLAFIGDFKRNLEHCEKAVQCCEAALGDMHAYTAHMYERLADAYRLLGKYDNMLPWMLKALRVREFNPDEPRWSIAETYLQIGNAYEFQRNYADALPWYKKAVTIFEEPPREHLILLSQGYASMGTAYDALKDYTQALYWFEKALPLRVELFGETHRHTVMLYALMAKGSYHLGNELVARQWLSEADAAYRQSDDIQAEGMSNVCSIIGAVYRLMGELKKALTWYERAVEILSAVLSPAHPDTAELYPYLAELYFLLGNTIKANEWAEKKAQ